MTTRAPEEITTRIMLTDWIDAIEAATEEIGPMILGCTAVETTGRSDMTAPGLAGAYLPLVADDITVQIGIMADDVNRRALAHGMLGLEPDGMSPHDIVDALGEIVNVLAGAVQKRMVRRVPNLRIGLPIFIEGSVHAVGDMQVITSGVRMDAIAAALLVVGPREVKR